MPSSRKNRGELQQGDRVKIAAHCGTKTDGDERSVELHGESGKIIGANPRYRDERGERKVSVLLENGALVCVPERALKRS